MGLFSKFKAGLAKTHAKLTHEIKRIVTRSPKLDAATLEEIETALIAGQPGAVSRPGEQPEAITVHANLLASFFLASGGRKPST